MSRIRHLLRTKSREFGLNGGQKTNLPGLFRVMRGGTIPAFSRQVTIAAIAVRASASVTVPPLGSAGRADTFQVPANRISRFAPRLSRRNPSTGTKNSHCPPWRAAIWPDFPAHAPLAPVATSQHLAVQRGYRWSRLFALDCAVQQGIDSHQGLIDESLLLRLPCEQQRQIEAFGVTVEYGIGHGEVLTMICVLVRRARAKALRRPPGRRAGGL